MTDWNGTTTYDYDANGQVTKVTNGNNQTIEYTWTKLGQKKSIKYPTGDSVSYTYDNNGNLTKVTDTNSGVTNYTYDALNQVKSKKLPNGAESTYTYDKNGWLTQREETSNGASKQSYTYEYDKNGNRTKETKVSAGTTETSRYTYDVLNQLTSVVDKNGTRNYAFDEFNNRTVKDEIGKETTKYSYNNLNQLVETVQGSTVATYDYDKRGNIAEVEENGDTKQTYVFDSTNKMSKVVNYKDNTSGSGTSTVTTKYTYDGVGNRVSAKVELNGSVTINTTYVVDGESAYNDIIMAKDSISGKTSVFTFSDEVISVETSGNISYYRNDEKHSVTDILDTTGKVKATIEYDEYGVIANPEVVSTGGNIFAYTGHVYEKSTGLYYAKARYYDAEIGRFVSEDSYRGELNDPLSQNFYTYCTNSPIVHYDLTGYILQRPIYSDGGPIYSKGNSHIYVTVDQLKKFGWGDTSKAFIKKLNAALDTYDITDKDSIALFMATMAEESGWGKNTIEQGSDAYFAKKKYGKNGRGAGYIQITWSDTHLEFLKTMKDDFSGKNTAKHISDNYPMEAAAWFWSNEEKTGDGNLNAYVKKNGGSLGIFLITQYFVNGLVTDKKGNVPKAFMDDLTCIRQGGAYKITSNSLIINGNTWRLPTNWDSRKDAYDKAIKAFK